MRLERGKHGADVGALQQLLLERGLDIPEDELQQQMFGPVTEQLIRDFQTANVDENGRALTVDGVVGPLTMAALRRYDAPQSWVAPDWHSDVVTLQSPIQDVVRAAVSDLGRRETPDGSNAGPMIAKFFPPNISGVPWCAYAVSTWLESAPGGSPFPHRFGAVADIVDWGKTRSLTRDTPLPGDLWCAQRGDGHGHVELVACLLANDRIATVGGNVRNAVRGVTRQNGSWSVLIRPFP